MIGEKSFLSVGATLKNRYYIEAEVGRGGYSVVYKAQDTKLQTTVAIKLLVPPPVAAITAKERLRREVVALQKLNHPSIIRIYDLNEEEHWSFIIMDYIDGGTLDQHVARHGPLSENEAREIGQQLSAALALAHQHGILHRDIKPQNIMLNRDGQAIITDFGSAKIEGQATFTATGAFVGTMDYIAPEVFNGDRPDGRSDIYSLGMSLYFAATGTLPQSHSKLMPPTPRENGFFPSTTGASISSEFDEIVARSTTVNPGQRFHTIKGMAKALNGDWLMPQVSQSTSLKFCLRCGGPDLLEISICPSCRTQTDGGDTCIFIEKELEQESRTHVQHILQKVSGISSKSSRLMDTVNGAKTLLRVPQESASGIVAKLRIKNIPAYSIPIKKAFSKAPFFLRMFLLINFAVGFSAGFFHSTFFIWVTPLFFGVALISTKRTILSPLIRPGAKTLSLPKDLETKVFKTLEILPSGSTRDLFADIVRTGSGLYAIAQKESLDPLFVHKLMTSMEFSCEVATDLSHLDQALLAISKHARSNPTKRKSMELMGTCEAHRDKMIQKLLEFLSILAMMKLHQGTGYDSALSELEAVTKELEEDCTIQIEAATEVKEYLEAGDKEVESC